MSEVEDFTATVRRALGLTVAIYEALPEACRPESSLKDMRALLDNQSDSIDPRRTLILTIEAIVTALVFRTSEAMGPSGHTYEGWGAWSVGRENRIREFRALFEALRQFDSKLSAELFDEACRRIDTLKRNDAPLE